MKRLFGALAIVALLATLGCGNRLDDGIAAYKDGRYWEAHEIFRPLAERGNPKAQYHLAMLYFDGKGVTQDDGNAAVWYRRAAEGGHVKAQYQLGQMHYASRGLPHDIVQAHKWYSLAAEQGHDGARTRVEASAREMTHEQLTDAYRLAAEYGHADAKRALAEVLYLLGEFHHRGSGVSRNYEEAARWYRLAAEQGHIEAQWQTGKMYFRGLGVLRDYEEAARWFHLSAEQGHTDAQLYLGYMYRVGQGVPQSDTQARSWFWSAAGHRHETAEYDLMQTIATRGVAEAQHMLGNIYYYGKGTSRDFFSAERWYRRAAEHGHADAQYSLAFMLNLLVCHPLDLLYYKSTYRNNKDAVDAIKRWRDHDHLYHPRWKQARYHRAREVERWYRLAAEQGHAKAQYVIANRYERSNYTEAVRWYRLAAEQGHTLALNGLGDMYYHGKGVRRNYSEALRLYLLSEAQGSRDARRSIGNIYRYGHGVIQDYSQAHAWFSLGRHSAERDSIVPHMTPEQIAEAERLVEEWLAARE